jgi:hypothetical protein
MSEDRLPSHPYAELFPLMQHPDFDALCGHIATNGLQEEIVLYEGQSWTAAIVTWPAWPGEWRRASATTPANAARRWPLWLPRTCGGGI